MTEIVGKEKITREPGYLYCVKKDGIVWAVPMKSQVKNLKAKKVSRKRMS